MAFWGKLLTWAQDGLQWGERVTAQVIPLSEFWFVVPALTRTFVVRDD